MSDVNLLTHESPSCPHPVDIAIRMYPHQLTLLKRMKDLETQQIDIETLSTPDMREMISRINDRRISSRTTSTNLIHTKIGILADKVGAGKSFAILALVHGGLGDRNVAPAPFSEIVTRSFADNRLVMTSDMVASGVMRATVLVVPHPLCTQWNEYIAKFGGGIRHISVNRTKHLQQLAEQLSQSTFNADLIIVSSTFHNKVADMMRGRRVVRVVYDEADSISIPGCSAIDASFHWFATASYGNLEHPNGFGTLRSTSSGYMRIHSGIRSGGFINSIFRELNSSTIGRVLVRCIVVKNHDDFVDASMQLPEPIIHCVQCRTPTSIRLLHGIVDHSIINFLNAGDAVSAMQHISPSNRTSEDNIVKLFLQKLENRHHNISERIAALPRMHYDTSEERRVDETRLATQLASIQVDMQHIRDRIADSDTCCICYDGFVDKTIVPCCSNSYCFACINRWITRNARCPLCKASLGTDALFVVTQQQQQQQEQADGASGSVGPGGTVHSNDKMQNLEAIVLSEPPEPSRRKKYLIFSSFENTFEDVTRLLDRLNLQWRYLKGNHHTTAAMEREYRSGSLDVLLVNTTNYGSGLNLENTTDVIMMHKFDTDIEHQVIGRAQRLGRSDALRIWYLMFDNEMPGGHPPQGSIPRA